jgi:hypothetical protein
MAGMTHHLLNLAIVREVIPYRVGQRRRESVVWCWVLDGHHQMQLAGVCLWLVGLDLVENIGSTRRE